MEWLTLIPQTVTAAILAVTLVLTGRLARATVRQANAAREQADLLAIVDARPLLSACRIQLTWMNGSLRSCALEIVNAGRGSCFNVSVRLDGLAGTWSLEWAADVDKDSYGALGPSDRRRLIATASGNLDATSLFDTQLDVFIECFDVMLQHYVFKHSFSVRHNISFALDRGLSMTVLRPDTISVEALGKRAGPGERPAPPIRHD